MYTVLMYSGYHSSVLGIDRVVLIFDLDGPMGGMLTYEDVKKRYTETYTVPKQVKILLQSIAGKNVKKTDAILDVPVLKQRLLEIDREIIEYLLGMSNNAFTLSELEV